MIVAINQVYGFDYTSLDQDNSLFVMASIYDVSSGYPGTLVGTVAMVNTTPGAYDGSYTFTVPGRLYKIAMAVYTDNTYTVINPNYAPISDMVQTLNPSNGVIAGNGSNIPLTQNPTTLPYVGDTMLDYFQPMMFETITKTVNGFQVVETTTPVNFQGVFQPFTDQQLAMKPEGQRAWAWFELHADPTVFLNPDDVVVYHGTQFRVMAKIDYTNYGYIRYHLVNDYTESGPTIL